MTLQPEQSTIVACTVARDVQNFDLLIEDMEAELGEAWGDLSFDEALAFLGQPDALDLAFIAVAVDGEDEVNLATIGSLISGAREIGVKVILITEDVSPIALHQLLRLGANDFVPYPLPEGALHDAIERLQFDAPVEKEADVKAESETKASISHDTRDGAIVAIHGLAGGAGASTFAVNLAWELANSAKEGAPKVCLLDLDLQFGAIATYLDLPRREAVYELLTDIENSDDEAFKATLLSFNEKLHVLTSPADILPLDLVSSEDIGALLAAAQRNFDYVIVDMPSTLVQWTETVLSAAHVYFSVVQLDIRSAQNVLRFIRALKAEDLPYEKIRYVLNRAPRFTDLSGKSRARRLAESLDISIDINLPDGGVAVTQACDHGLPLSETNARNPLRKEIVKLAQSLRDLETTDAARTQQG